MSSSGWREVYRGGSPEAERRHFEELARGIVEVQEQNRERSGGDTILRAFHAKPIVATSQAEFRFVDDLPAEFRAQFAQPGASYPATVRISNAGGTVQSDKKRDLRGIAIRVHTPEGDRDLLATNYPVPHARDGEQFIAFALAMSGSRLRAIPRLVRAVGLSEAVRMLANVINAARRTVRSAALETYWSRGALLWDGAGPVRYLVRPAAGAAPAREPSGSNANYLRNEIGRRLVEGDVSFEFCVQRFVDEARTPIEDAAHEWREEDAPPVHIATLTLRQQNIYTPQAHAAARAIEALAFNPWHTTDEFRPLGNLNRARKAVYEAGAAHRLGSAPDI